jgi:hypothetical protein
VTHLTLPTEQGLVLSVVPDRVSRAHSRPADAMLRLDRQLGLAPQQPLDPLP